MTKLDAASIGLTDTTNNYAVLVAGRRISLDAVEGAGLTRRKLAAIVETVARWSKQSGLPLAYVHMGTTANWEKDAEAPIVENADAIVGVVLAQAVYPGQPEKVERARFTKATAADVPAGLFEELANEYGLEAEPEGGLFLAPAGWTVANVYPPTSTYDAENQTFEPQGSHLATTCVEDFPPGVELEAADLPDVVWLGAFYA